MQEKAFLTDIAKAFFIGPSAARVAVAVFDTKANTVFEFADPQNQVISGISILKNRPESLELGGGGSRHNGHPLEIRWKDQHPRVTDHFNFVSYCSVCSRRRKVDQGDHQGNFYGDFG